MFLGFRFNQSETFQQAKYLDWPSQQYEDPTRLRNGPRQASNKFMIKEGFGFSQAPWQQRR